MLSYRIFDKDTVFLPGVHGWPFANEYDLEEALGMVYLALDYFYAGQFIGRNQHAPTKRSHLRSMFKSRGNMVLVSLKTILANWTNSMNSTDRYDKTWEMLDSIQSLDHPRVLILLRHSYSLFKKYEICPVVVHHVDWTSTNECRLYIYDPHEDDNVSELDTRVAGSDLNVFFCPRTPYDSGAIGYLNHGFVYGAFEYPYDRPVPGLQTTAEPTLSSIQSEVVKCIWEDRFYRVDSVGISIPWSGNYVPYHSLKLDWENMYTRYSTTGCEVFTLMDMIRMFSTDGVGHPDLGDLHLYFPLTGTSGTQNYVFKTVIEPFGCWTRVIRIDLPGLQYTIEYKPKVPEVVWTFYTRWPDFFELGYVDSELTHGVTSDQVTVRDDYDTSIHGEIPASQTVLVEGSGRARGWDNDASLSENLFGACTSVGFITKKISCAKRSSLFFDQVDTVITSFWSRQSPGDDPFRWCGCNKVVTEEERFCVNDILTENSPNIRISDGFRDIDFDQDAYIDLNLRVTDKAGWRIDRQLRLYARMRLVFSGIEPPHLKYLEMDLRDWILGPYLEESVEDLGMPGIHGSLETNRTMYVEEVSRMTGDVLQHISEMDTSDFDFILEMIRKHRRVMRDQLQSHLLNSEMFDSKAFEDRLISLRRSCYHSLMNELAGSMIRISGKGLRTDRRIGKTGDANELDSNA